MNWTIEIHNILLASLLVANPLASREPVRSPMICTQRLSSGLAHGRHGRYCPRQLDNSRQIFLVCNVLRQTWGSRARRHFRDCHTLFWKSWVLAEDVNQAKRIRKGTRNVCRLRWTAERLLFSRVAIDGWITTGPHYAESTHATL